METRNAFQLANDADVTTPDTVESAGSQFLLGIQSAVFEAIEDADDDTTADDLRDRVSEIVDGLVPVYTYPKWMAFVDLAAWQEDLSEWMDGLVKVDEAMDRLSDLALYQIADRLANRIIDAWESENEDD